MTYISAKTFGILTAEVLEKQDLVNAVLTS